jgi:microcin C transport system substrate-binding protein
VLFTFRNAENRELPLILGQLPVLPSKWWASRDFEKSVARGRVVERRLQGRLPSMSAARSSIAASPDWWAKDLWMNRGRNNFETMRYEYYRDAEVTFEAFKAGDTDVRRENSGAQLDDALRHPGGQGRPHQARRAANEMPQPMQGFVFNLRRELFKDRRVREAIGLMYDFEWQNKNLSYGFFTRSRSFFGNSSSRPRACRRPRSSRSRAAQRARSRRGLHQGIQPAKTDGSGNIREQARQAIGLLKQAGWEVKDGKMTETKTGKKLAFEMLLNDASFERVVLPYKQNLERIGVDMNVRTIDTAQFKRRDDEFDFDMMVTGFGQSLSPGNEQRDFWGSKAADTKGSRNVIGIRDAAIDNLVETLIGAPDRESLINATRALDRVLLWSHFVVPNWHSNTAYVAYWNRFARPTKAAKYAPVAFDTWWIDEAKDRAAAGRRSDRIGDAGILGRSDRCGLEARGQRTRLMLAYILRRLMLVVPTLFGIMVLNFFIIQARPAGRSSR